MTVNDQVVAWGLATATFSWINPYTLVIIFTRVLSPLMPPLTLISIQFYLISLPIFANVLIPDASYVLIRAIYQTCPYPNLFWVSFFQFGHFDQYQNDEYYYYTNGLKSYAIWTFCGQ